MAIRQMFDPIVILMIGISIYIIFSLLTIFHGNQRRK
jgi:hypothetical protein